jgi:hypothetical protein
MQSATGGSDLQSFISFTRKEIGQMATILIIVLLIVLLGGGGGYYGYSRYGGAGLGGALGLVLVILVAVWLLGGLHMAPA